MRIFRGHKVMIEILTVLVLLGVYGCSQEATRPEPLLPRGFSGARIPDIDGLQGYVYLDQASPVTVSGGLMHGLPSPITMEAGSLWVGSDIRSVGGAVVFGGEDEANSVAEQLATVKDTVWSSISGRTLYLTTRSGAWKDALQDAIGRQALVIPGEKYPGVKEDFTLFPASPPDRPVGAGFLSVEDQLVKSLDSLGVKVSDIALVLKGAKVGRVAFVLYAERTVDMITADGVGGDFFGNVGASALLVGRSGYPGAVLGMFFDGAMQSAGLQKSTVDGVDIYAYELSEARILVTRKGSVLFGAVAVSSAGAEKLLLNAVK